ncbi:hypothetical protein FACS1894174_05890 [Bacteroidia bacterium]|nr:hypothetical protein FACS1894174_05890 [Bacteroidia bacterium]
MSYKIIFSKIAQKDLDDILDYLLENWGECVIDQFRISMNILLERLSMYPHMGMKIISDHRNIRSIPLNEKILIVYSADYNFTIKIIRVFDVRQDPKKKFRNIK